MLKGHIQGHSDAEGYFVQELGLMLLLNTNRRPYSSPPLIGTPLLTTNSVLIRALSSGERKHHLIIFKALAAKTFVSSLSTNRLSFKRLSTVYGKSNYTSRFVTVTQIWKAYIL